MLKLDLAAIFSGAMPIDDALLADSVLVQYRAQWMKPKADQLFLAPAGATISDIVCGLIAEGHIPAEVAALGSVYLADGGRVDQENWRKVRPKTDAVLFLSIVPEGGDNTFALIAGIAVAAFAIAVSGGALATLAPALFGTAGLGLVAGSTAAQVAGAVVGCGGSFSPNLVTP